MLIPLFWNVDINGMILKYSFVHINVLKMCNFLCRQHVYYFIDNNNLIVDMYRINKYILNVCILL